MLKLALFLLFTGCAQTSVYDSGRLVATIQGDAVNVTVTSRGGSFHADTLNHSVPTTAAYGGATSLAGGVATGVVAGMLAKP